MSLTKLMISLIFVLALLSIGHLYFQKSVLNAHRFKKHNHVVVEKELSVEVTPEEELNIDLESENNTNNVVESTPEVDNIDSTNIENDIQEKFMSFDEQYHNIVKNSVDLNRQSMMNNMNEFRI